MSELMGNRQHSSTMYKRYPGNRRVRTVACALVALLSSSLHLTASGPLGELGDGDVSPIWAPTGPQNGGTQKTGTQDGRTQNSSKGEDQERDGEEILKLQTRLRPRDFKVKLKVPFVQAHHSLSHRVDHHHRRGHSKEENYGSQAHGEPQAQSAS